MDKPCSEKNINNFSVFYINKLDTNMDWTLKIYRLWVWDAINDGNVKDFFELKYFFIEKTLQFHLLNKYNWLQSEWKFDTFLVNTICFKCSVTCQILNIDMIHRVIDNFVKETFHSFPKINYVPNPKRKKEQTWSRFNKFLREFGKKFKKMLKRLFFTSADHDGFNNRSG